MSAPLVFSYYGRVPDLDREAETKLQLLWLQHWREAGFNPRVLTERDAMRHPGYFEFIDVMAQMPSINPKGYDLACYARWVAVTQAIKEADALFAFMSDYDTFPTFRTRDEVDALCRHLATPGQSPDDEAEAYHLVCYQKYVPCFVGGTADCFSQQCARFAKYSPPPGTEHTSDMLILEGQIAKEPDSFKALDIAKLWSEPGWEHAPLIHFSNSVMGPANKFPRHKFIPEILEWLRTK